MKRLIKKHKNTVTAVISAGFIIFFLIRYFTGQITFSELGQDLGMVAAVASTIIGLLAPDGSITIRSSKTNEEKLDACSCNGSCHCLQNQ